MIRSAALTLLLGIGLTGTASAQTNPNPVPKDPSAWPQHSLNRPKPPVVAPGAMGSTGAPSDAIVLFDGKSLTGWRSADSTSTPARWTLVDGAMEVAPGTGSIMTRRTFGDVQLHVEWRSPTPPMGEGQERGRLTVPARLTVFLNGILVQEDQLLLGPTSHGVRTPYANHASQLPLQLQDHGVKARFRNIWLRELDDG